MSSKKASPVKEIGVQITAPKINVISLQIRGTAPYVQNRFSAKAQKQMADKMANGTTSKKGGAREKRNYEEECKEATHFTENGTPGIPASAFRNAMISACRLVNFKMTIGKLSLWVETDQFDKIDKVPLVPIKGKSVMDLRHVKIQMTCSLVSRPMFFPWSAEVKIGYDADQFTATDVVNLMNRVGKQVGIGEGRPDSKTSAGMGWGTFEIVNA